MTFSAGVSRTAHRPHALGGGATSARHFQFLRFVEHVLKKPIRQDRAACIISLKIKGNPPV